VEGPIVIGVVRHVAEADHGVSLEVNTWDFVYDVLPVVREIIVVFDFLRQVFDLVSGLV